MEQRVLHRGAWVSKVRKITAEICKTRQGEKMGKKFICHFTRGTTVGQVPGALYSYFFLDK